MGRPPLPVGTFGKIDFLVLGKDRVRARASFRDYDGHRRLVTRYGSSRAHAERRLREALRDRGTGDDPVASATSRLSEVAALWLAEVDDSDLAWGTKRLYRFTVESYILPGLGELRLREVTVPAVNRLLATVSSLHGPAAAKSTRSVLSGILGLAVRHGLLPANPVREAAIRRGSRTSRGPRALTVEETRQLRARLAADPDAVRRDLPDLVDFMLGTGVRIGEACAIQPSAIDFEAATLTVDATVIRIRGLGLVIQDSPKSTAGRRTLVLPSAVVDLLRRRIAVHPRPDADALVVFPSPQGRLRDSSNTSGDLRSALDRAEFPWVTSHVFRKTVATRLDDAGLSARQIADHLGHSRPSLTQDVYLGRGHASPEAAAALQRSR
ncbi:site-specific recombinase XerD [Blastococcus colisei]|uniref:Site-specific recombinase XerD n=1 Tax=Blastococcus colisei TaxID=1564162 RepID=A0A543PIB1_9ACTN|nr:site-specific integrase [Blastococcus colisei]TQN43821.1 site-specific recombinase XerD [Blastococcus colisei]